MLFQKGRSGGVKALFLSTILLTCAARNKFCLLVSFFFPLFVVFKSKLGRKQFCRCDDVQQSLGEVFHDCDASRCLLGNISIL